jgi:hypothetical protein
MTINRQKPQRSAGAFLGPDQLIPAPIRTLSDEIPASDPEPEEEREPPPEPPGIVERVRAAAERLTHKSSDSGQD